MSVSLHEILDMNDRQLLLNPLFKFFERGGKTYGYINRVPFRISFMELSPALKNILLQFDGHKSVNQVLLSNSLDVSFFEFLKLLYRNSVLRDKDKEIKYPEHHVMGLTFYPTSSCNLRCVYCYASAGDNPAITLDPDKAESWINYLFENRKKEVEVVKVNFHGGGEPTNAFPIMRKIWELVKARCEKENLTPHLSSISNGNFSEAVMDWFIQEKAFVYFSMDGVKEYHNALRPRADGKGSFEPLFHNLKKIKEAGLKTGIRCTITSGNKSQLMELVDFAKQNDLDFLHFEQFNEYGRSENPSELSVSGKEYPELYAESWNYALDKGIKMIGHPTVSISPGKKVFCSSFSKKSFSLTPEGYLTHCPEVSQSSDPVSDIFFAGKILDDGSIEFFEDRIEKLKERIPPNLKDCRECFLEYTCNGGCMVKSYRNNPDLMKVNSTGCDSERELAFLLLNSVLQRHDRMPEDRKLEYLEYSFADGKQIHAECASFLPFY